MSTGVVAGMVVGAAVAVALLVIGILYYKNYRKKGKYGIA